MKSTFRLAVFAALAASAVAANATVTIYFSTLYTGVTPNGAIPWATLTITDGANAGDVDFSLTTDLASPQFLSQLMLNTVANPSGMTMSASSGTFSFAASEDGFSDAGQQFDVKIGFPTANNGTRIDDTNSATWTLSQNGLTENSFSALSTPSHDDDEDGIEALLHVQGIPDGDEGTSSGKITPGPVPEPASLATLGLGALALLRRRKK